MIIGLISCKELADHLHTHLSCLSLLQLVRARAREAPHLGPILLLESLWKKMQHIIAQFAASGLQFYQTIETKMIKK